MINSFNELLNDLFYDWDSYYPVKLNIGNNGEFYTNKTSIFQKENKYFLHYKTEQSEINKKVYTKFVDFYLYLYKEDAEFQKFTDTLSNAWFDNDNKKLKYLEDRIIFNSLIVFYNGDKTATIQYETMDSFIVRPETLSKIEMFFKMIKI